MNKSDSTVPFKFDIGDDVWYWYFDDNDYHVWYGTISAIMEDGSVHVCYDSFTDLEENDYEPYVVEFTVQPENVFETRLEAVVDAALNYQERIDKAVDDELQQEEEGKQQWQARSWPDAPVTDFEFKQGDTVYSVIPYAAGTVLEMTYGTVQATPQSDNPRWFCLSTKDGWTMAPTAFTATTPEAAAQLYAKSKVKQIMDSWNKKKDRQLLQELDDIVNN